MNKKIVVLAFSVLLVAGCGPFRNKYVEPTDRTDMVAVEVSYSGDFVYPQPLVFDDGKTCVGPKSLNIQPQGTQKVFIRAGQLTTFMLGDLSPLYSSGAGLGVSSCKMAFSFTPQAERSYRVTRNRTRNQCSIRIVESNSSGRRDISSTIAMREYSIPFFGGDGPYCKD